MNATTSQTCTGIDLNAPLAETPMEATTAQTNVAQTMPNVALSERAAQHVLQFIQKRGKGLGLKLGVRTTGCSGLAYKLEFVDTPNTEDIQIESRGVTLFIEPKSLPYLRGIELDYTREGLNEGFKFINPNEKARCGCGESFTV